MKTSRIPLALLCALVIASPGATGAAPGPERALDCTIAFPAAISHASLVSRHGASNVVDAEIEIGEGQRERGTVLFTTSDADRLEILWQDPHARTRPRRVIVRGERSNWTAPRGLALGTDLRNVERINGRPFRLAGFGWDYGGTQLAWSGGTLEHAAGPGCTLRVRLNPPVGTDERSPKQYAQVTGGNEYSSSHPAMQAINPRVHEIWLEYR